MSILQSGARAGAATFVVGISLAWPQAAGIASADKPDQESSSVSAGPAKSGTSSARAHRSNASRPSDNAPATAATRGRTAATAAAPARSTAAARSAPTASQSRRVTAGRAIEDAVADAVLGAIGITRPDPASTAGTTTAFAAVATVAVTTTPKVAASTATAPVPANADKVSTLTVPRANDVVSVITDFFSGLVGSVQSLIEGAGLLIRRFLFNQAPTVLPIQTSGQTTGQSWSTITGTVNAVDPEDDTIIYSVVQPEHGTVTIDSNGNYTYVPNTGPDGFTGADTFTVTATDTGLHINLLDLGRAPSTQTIVSVEQIIGAPRVGYTFVFGDGGRYWSSAARAALETTAIDLSSYFIVSNAVIITYSVTGQRTLIGSTLASAGSDLVSTLPGFYDTVVQQKIQDGTDANGSAPDGQIDWNFGYSWALGNSVASNQYDFTSTAMHELLHSFGFLSVVDSAGNNTGTNWTTFDSFVVTANGTAPIDHTTYAWSTLYDTNLTGGANGLYFGGLNAKAAYGGNPVPLYTPKPWESGSSMSHLDDFTFTSASAQLMNAVSDTGLGIRTLSGIEIGILRDLGYNVANTPQTLAIFVIGFAFIRRRKRNAELAAV
jgi:hypothetical protein